MEDCAEPRPGPLAGVTVLDLGQIYNGPYATFLMAMAAGLNPTEKSAMGALIARLRDERRIDVLVVEHDMKLIMSICDRILVMRQGCRIALGTPDAIRADEAVIEAYLGADYEFA